MPNYAFEVGKLLWVGDFNTSSQVILRIQSRLSTWLVLWNWKCFWPKRAKFNFWSWEIVVGCGLQPFEGNFLQEAAETQLSGMSLESLDFRDRWILPFSVAEVAEWKLHKHLYSIEPGYTYIENPITRLTLYQLAKRHSKSDILVLVNLIHIHTIA